MVNEADLGLPLDVLLIVATRRVQPQPQVGKTHFHGLASDAEIELTMALFRVDADRTRQPRGGKNVLATGIYKGKRSGGDIVSDQCDRHDWRRTTLPSLGPSS